MTNDPAPCSCSGALPWQSSRRILILIAHPDDEVVGCCAAIGRARAAGAEVFGLNLTTGVPAREVLWPWERGGHAARVAVRRDEGRQAAGLLGFTEVTFRALPTRCLRTTLLVAREEILATLRRIQADALWAPAYEGGHADHDSANVLAASLRESVSGGVYEYAEYNFSGGEVRSQQFLAPTGREFVLTLTAEERQLKRQALAAYRSAQGDLNYVGVEREALRPLAEYDYTRPPHPGKLFYQRFQWVFFRHPRIDFTRPEEACRDFQAFRASGQKRS